MNLEELDTQYRQARQAMLTKAVDAMLAQGLSAGEAWREASMLADQYDRLPAAERGKRAEEAFQVAGTPQDSLWALFLRGMTRRDVPWTARPEDPKGRVELARQMRSDAAERVEERGLDVLGRGGALPLPPELDIYAQTPGATAAVDLDKPVTTWLPEVGRSVDEWLLPAAWGLYENVSLPLLDALGWGEGQPRRLEDAVTYEDVASSMAATWQEGVRGLAAGIEAAGLTGAADAIEGATDAIAAQAEKAEQWGHPFLRSPFGVPQEMA